MPCKKSDVFIPCKTTATATATNSVKASSTAPASATALSASATATTPAAAVAAQLVDRLLWLLNLDLAWLDARTFCA